MGAAECSTYAGQTAGVTILSGVHAGAAFWTDRIQVRVGPGRQPPDFGPPPRNCKSNNFLFGWAAGWQSFLLRRGLYHRGYRAVPMAAYSRPSWAVIG